MSLKCDEITTVLFRFKRVYNIQDAQDVIIFMGIMPMNYKLVYHGAVFSINSPIFLSL